MAGYCSTDGRAFFTLARFCTNVELPGRFWSSCLRNDASLPTDCRIGRAPGAGEVVLTCSAAVSQRTKSTAACRRSEPLSKTTQLSGPAIVWCPADEPANVGITCTP